MSDSRQFRCVIVGETSLPIRCGEILSKRGHEIAAVLSEDGKVRAWVKEQGLTLLDSGADPADQLADEPFDLLLSIINYRILDEKLLSLPSELAINYHDAPLPRYAGTHATSWAIANGETQHAVTWHAMAVRVDAGEILKQQVVAIDDRETSRTLNMKCYDAAVASFEELIEELETGRTAPAQQDEAQRTFFAKYKRPPTAAFVDWEKRAEEIDRFVRALDFGRAVPNPLGAAKIEIEGEPYVVAETRVVAAPSAMPPGTVESVDPDRIEVATATKRLAILRLVGVDGDDVQLHEVAARHRLEKGQALGRLSPAEAQRLTALNKTLTRKEGAWIRRLADLRPPELPFLSRAGRGEAAGAHETIEVKVPPGLGDSLTAGIAAYLTRVSSVEEFDVGFARPGADPELAGFERLVATTLPLRVEKGEGARFVDVSEKIGARLARLRKRRTYLRDVVLRDPRLNGADGITCRPAYPVAIVVADDPDSAALEPGCQLAFIVSVDGGSCALRYDPCAVAGWAARGAREQLGAFLAGVAADPARPIEDQPLLGDEERRRIVFDWNETGTGYPKESTVHELVEAQAGRRPDATAVELDGRSLTYRQMNERANLLAHHLRASGVGPGVMVGLYLNRSPELIVAMLAVLKAGGAYLPLPSQYPPERIAFMLEDAKAPIVLTEEERAGALPDAAKTIFCIDRDWHTIEGLSRANPSKVSDPETLAYVIFTSGSTGEPKGVAVPHRAIVRLVVETDYVEIDETDVIAQASNASFDAATFEIWGALIGGAKLHIVPRSITLSPKKFAARLRDGGITKLFITTALFNQVARQVPDAFATLSDLMFGGELVDPQWVRTVLEHGPPRRLLHVYGPTENTTFSTWHLVEEVPEDAATVPIGRPLANTTMYVLDKHERPVPVGIPGELYLGGDGLADGYMNRVELTAERFVPDTVTGTPGERLYKTGDLVRYLPDRSIEFIGRVDHQVKLRGFRIELGEIEARLAQHPDLREVIVLLRQDEPGDKQIVAYVVSAPGAGPSTSELRQHLMEKLPEYMVPAAFVQMDELPLNKNGKVDRAALPKPDAQRPDLEQELVAPRDEIESRLVTMWEEVLGRSPVGVLDDFFELGGDSLKSVRLFDRVEEQLGVVISPDMLFRAPTVEGIATIVRGDAAGGTREMVVPVQVGGSKLPLFAVPAAASPGIVYEPLARRLGADQPFYGMTPPDLDGRAPTDDWFAATAEVFVREIKKIQPEGPYHLAGYCFGAFLALETAHQLIAAGDEVAMLAALDSGAPFFTGESIRRSFGEKLRRSRLKLRQFIINRIRHLPIEVVVLPGLPAVYLMDEEQRKTASHTQQVWDANLRAAEHYLARPYPRKLTLILSERMHIHPKVKAGWEAIAANGIDYHVIPGRHDDSLKEPFVGHLAEKLAIALERSRQRDDSRQLVLQ
ncbi:MAG: amino acid adenylation domain-containing protein [Acidobacteriota bacterium]|nr:amino acid adenylation domain-containing protein [Acidobacteriota bacterium]